MKSQTKNKITIEKLAQMMARGFESLEDRFGKHLDSHDVILNTMLSNIDNIQADIKDIKNNIKSVTELTKDNEKEITSLDVRVTHLEEHKMK